MQVVFLTRARADLVRPRQFLEPHGEPSIRDGAQRELLFDLDTARRQMFAREGKSAEYDLVSKSLANLMRMWVED